PQPYQVVAPSVNMASRLELLQARRPFVVCCSMVSRLVELGCSFSTHSPAMLGPMSLTKSANPRTYWHEGLATATDGAAVATGGTVGGLIVARPGVVRALRFPFVSASWSCSSAWS